MCASNPYPRELPKTQTTSPLAARFQCFSPRWSAFWVPRSSGRPLDGGNCTTRGCDTPATRRKRASCSAKPPPATVVERTCGSGRPRPSAHERESPATGPKGGPLPVQNSPSTPLPTACAVQNSPSSPEMARFGAFSTCRESFVPLSPPRSCAGRILYRTAELGLANRTPGPTRVEGAGGTGVEGAGGFRGTAWPRCRWAVVEPGRSIHKQQEYPAQANFACNSPTTRIHARSKTAEYQRSDFNT